MTQFFVHKRSAIDRAVEDLHNEGKIQAIYWTRTAPVRYIINAAGKDALMSIDLERRLLIHENTGVIVFNEYTPAAEVRSTILRYIRMELDDQERIRKEAAERDQGKLL